MTQYDLHTHSIASDGSLTPTELVERACQQGVTHLALTDHDGTEGIIEAQQAASEKGIQLIAGVEISTTWQGTTIHVVGLGIDINNPELQHGLATLRHYRQLRAEKIAEKLEKAGISGALDGARKFASATLLGRVHFAHYLIEQGHAVDMQDVFKRFLVRNKPGYVASEWASLDDAVAWIKKAGGQAVIAHPARYKLTATKRRKLIAEFKAMGGDALEVSSGCQHAEEVRAMGKLAEEFELLASCGSDFHSPGKAWNELGKITALPPFVTPVWSQWH